jgi:O-antigen/teichoic acid export membrane protein
MSLIRRNIFWLLVSQLATWMATLAALVIVPNRLGATDFGTFAYATGFVMFFTLVAGLGTSTYLSRAIARDYDLLGPYVWNAVLLKFVLWGVLSAAALGLAYAIGNRGQTLVMIAISCAGMLPYILSEVFFGGLAGMQRMARPAMWMVVQVYFQTVFGILVLVLGWGVVAYTAVMTMGVLIPCLATALMVRPLVHGHRRFDFKIWRLLVVGGIPLLALNFFNTVYGTVDVPILHAIVGSDPVGWYTVALKWVSIPLFITTAVAAAFFPEMSKHGNPMTDEFAPLVNRSVNIVLFVTIPASWGLVLVADDLVRFIYAQDYDPSIVLIQILAFQIPITAMDTVLATALVAADRLNRYLFVAAIAAILNPIACVIAVNITDSRYDNGAIGAAIVMVGTELWVMIGALYLRAPGVLDRAEVGRILRITAATAAMTPVLLLAGDWPILIQVSLGVVVYAIASLAFGGISIAELRDMVGQMTKARRRDRLGDEPDEGSADDATAATPAGVPHVGGDVGPDH